MIIYSKYISSAWRHGLHLSRTYSALCPELGDRCLMMKAGLKVFQKKAKYFIWHQTRTLRSNKQKQIKLM